MSRRRPGGLRAALTTLAVVAALGSSGCVLGPSSLDGPLAVNLHVATTPTTIEIEAPTWYADTSAIFVCPSDPPPLPEPGPERQDWTPGSGCHDFGTQPSPDGLVASLATADIPLSDRSAFAGAEDWYLLLLDVDPTGRVTSAARTRFGRPDGFVG